MATLSQAGIPGVGSPGILMPKLKNRWRVTFVNWGGAGGNSQDISMQAVTCSRPKMSFVEVKMDRYNSIAYAPGKHEFEPLQIVIEDDITNRASWVIQKQLEVQQRLIGADGPWLNTTPAAGSIKFLTRLEMLDGNEGVVELWNCEGSWIQQADYGELSYSESEAVQISLTIRFDHAQQVINPNGYGTALGGFV